MFAFAYNAITGACISGRELESGKTCSFQGRTRQDTKNVVRGYSEPDSSTTVFGRKYLGEGIAQHTEHYLEIKPWVKEGWDIYHLASSPPTLLKKAYPQFHPNSAGELRAVVLANRTAPVKPGFAAGSLNNDSPGNQGCTCPRRQPKSRATRRMEAQ